MSRSLADIENQNRRLQGYETDSSVSDGPNRYIELLGQKIALNASLKLAPGELARAKELDRAQRTEEAGLAITNNEEQHQVTEFNLAMDREQTQISVIQNRMIPDAIPDLNARLEAATRQLEEMKRSREAKEVLERTEQENYQGLLLQQSSLKTKEQQLDKDIATAAASDRQKDQTIASLQTTLQEQAVQISNKSNEYNRKEALIIQWGKEFGKGGIGGEMCRIL